MPWTIIRSALAILVTTFSITVDIHAENLSIYWIDVEGGAATLIITPSRRAILMDAGWSRADSRDSKRIKAALDDAKMGRIDYFIASHFHRDHVGGLLDLSKTVEIGTFIDHGESVEVSPERRQPWESYQRISKNNRRTIRPGDKLPFSDLEFLFVLSNGETLERPLMPLGPNPYCQNAVFTQPEPGENTRSIGYLLSLGGFQFLDLGDATINMQDRLACPENLIGEIDLLQIPHHGNDLAPQLLWALRPQATVTNNGPNKGGSAEGFNIVSAIPKISDTWQLHRPNGTPPALTAKEVHIANLASEDDCHGFWIKAVVDTEGRSYSISNGRTGFSQTYLSR